MEEEEDWEAGKGRRRKKRRKRKIEGRRGREMCRVTETNTLRIL